MQIRLVILLIRWDSVNAYLHKLDKFMTKFTMFIKLTKDTCT